MIAQTWTSAANRANVRAHATADAGKKQVVALLATPPARRQALHTLVLCIAGISSWVALAS